MCIIQNIDYMNHVHKKLVSLVNRTNKSIFKVIFTWIYQLFPYFNTKHNLSMSYWIWAIILWSVELFVVFSIFMELFCQFQHFSKEPKWCQRLKLATNVCFWAFLESPVELFLKMWVCFETGKRRPMLFIGDQCLVDLIIVISGMLNNWHLWELFYQKIV